MGAPLYKPPTRVSTRQTPYLSMVTRADPDFMNGKFREVEYSFSGKNFLANPYVRGAYDRLSNVYPVGQPQGAPDPLVTAALAPTVGNAVPGLYSGVDDAKGWA